MRLRFAFLVGFCAACSLNPQPFPPDTTDGGSDASLLGAPDSGEAKDSGAFGDASPGPDATIDAGEPDAGDGGLDASDASEDATEDAPEDATLDGRDDG